MAHSATRFYECPKCLETPAEDFEPPMGQFKVIALVNPGSAQTRHHPGDPPSIEEITHLNAVSECEHAEDEETQNEVEKQFREDFANGSTVIEYGHPHYAG